eukprot:c33603_g1_i1 orf=2-325(-)
MAATDAEIDALLDLKTGFNDPLPLASWRRERGMMPRPTGPLPPPPCSGWTGVSCSNQTLSVVSITLPNRFQGGYIRPSIASLPFLQILDLSGNRLAGSIPAEITGLRG